MNDYYSILQVDRHASAAVIKAAYRKLAVHYHPDINKQPDATERFQQINEAYRILSDEGKRLMYDLSLVEPVQHTVPTATTARRRHRPERPFSPVQEKSLYELVVPYLKYSGLICKVAFTFCLFLFIDYYLPYQTSTEKVTLIEKYIPDGPGSITIGLYTDKGSAFPLPTGQHDYFRKGEEVVIERTLLSGSNLNIFKKSDPRMSIRAFGSIYSAKIFMVLALAVCSFLGGFTERSPNISFSFGVASGFLLLTVYFLL